MRMDGVGRGGVRSGVGRGGEGQHMWSASSRCTCELP